MSEVSDAPAVTQPAEFKTTVTSSEVEPKVLPAEGDKKPTADSAPAQDAKAPVTEEPKDAQPEGEAKADDKSGDDDAAKAEAKRKREDRQLKNRLFKENAELRAALARQQAEIAARQQMPQEPQPQAVQTSAVPDISQYETTEAWVAAVREHERRNIVQELTQRQQAEHARATQAQLEQNWAKHVAAGEDKYEDFHEVVGALNTDVPWIRALKLSENGADVAYYLGTHLDEAQKIHALPPDSQGLAIGKLSAKLAAQPKKEQPVSKAPDPITPLQGSSIVRDTMPSDEDDINTWMKKENMRLAKRLHA